jgi:hypothetical protein
MEPSDALNSPYGQGTGLSPLLSVSTEDSDEDIECVCLLCLLFFRICLSSLSSLSVCVFGSKYSSLFRPHENSPLKTEKRTIKKTTILCYVERKNPGKIPGKRNLYLAGNIYSFS